MSVRVLVLSLLLFMVAFGAHEVMHLLLIFAVGADGSIIARPWRLGYVDLTIYALHAQPAHPLDAVRQAVVNFFGPLLAAIPLSGVLPPPQAHARRSKTASSKPCRGHIMVSLVFHPPPRV